MLRFSRPSTIATASNGISLFLRPNVQDGLESEHLVLKAKHIVDVLVPPPPFPRKFVEALLAWLMERNPVISTSLLTRALELRPGMLE